MINDIDFDKVLEIVKSTKSIVFNEKLKNCIKMKGEADFVTDIDYRISSYIGNALAVLTPGIGLMSEEEKNDIVSTRWILDPIDGTTNLVYGYNMCSVSLALCIDEVIEFGIVYNPFNEDVFVGRYGKGAWLNGEKISQIPNRELNQCLIEFGAGATKKHHMDVSFDIGKEVFKNCLDIRRICSSALSICFVAAGRINGYFEKELKPWDYAAAGLILEECGGYMSDWQGGKIEYTKPSSFVCGSEKAYNYLLNTIQRIERE